MTPVVTNLIIINVLMFAAQNLITQFDVNTWGSLHYYKSDLFKPLQFVTSLFMHGSFTHILFNMFTLYMFGTILERYWGPKRFLLFYFICGICSSALTQVTIPFSVDQMIASGEFKDALLQYSKKEVAEGLINQYSELGASGAIMGVMAAFAYLFPNTELYVMLIPIPVKAKYVIPFFVLIDLLGGIYHIKGDNIGHFAHLGGALTGFLLVLYWNKTKRKTLY
jgi:rhomboid-like protein